MATLTAVCNGFGITLSQFFAEDGLVELTPELQELFDIWVLLTAEEKATAKQLIKAISKK